MTRCTVDTSLTMLTGWRAPILGKDARMLGLIGVMLNGTKIHLHGTTVTSCGPCIVHRVQGQSSGTEIHGSMLMVIHRMAESLRMD